MITAEQARGELARRELARRELARRESSKVESDGKGPLSYGGMAGMIPRGVQAVQKGLSVKDIPGIAVKTISEGLSGAPERIMQRPRSFALSGPVGVQMSPYEQPEKNQIPYPKPISEGGKQVANDFGMVASALPIETVASPVAKGLNEVRRFGLNPTSEGLTKKAQKMTTEILQPSKGQLEAYLKQGRQHPAIEQATDAMAEAKDYSSLKDHIAEAVSGKMGERNKILAENNFPVGREYVRPLIKEVRSMRRPGSQVTDAEYGQAKNVLKSEFDYLRANKPSRLDAQSRKEYLQDLTERLLEKNDLGENVSREPARSRALDTLRSGLKDAVEGGDPRVRALNETYGGLHDAKGLAAGQEALAQKAIPENMLEAIFSHISKPADIPMSIARRTLARQSDLPKKTKRISELVKKARSLKP